MFTGIITDIGTIISRTDRGDVRLRISCNYDASTIKLGESIACNGACLTVVDKSDHAPYWFDVELSQETLNKTSAGWQMGNKLNLERALRVGDDLSGHMVSGHVDGVAKLLQVAAVGESHTLTFEAPKDLCRFIAPKGSVTLSGVSLTVNAVDGQVFSVNIIPHTWKHTNLSDLAVSDTVNLEIDLIARYLAQLIPSSCLTEG
jgi:riboflavin synthase